MGCESDTTTVLVDDHASAAYETQRVYSISKYLHLNDIAAYKC